MGCTCSSEEQSMSQNVSSNRHYKSNRNSQRERDDRYPHQRRHNNNNNNQDCSDNNNIFQPNFEPFLQSRIDPYFNFPEVEGEVYVGEGLKKMKGYISQISKEEILKKREEFWQTRVEGNKDTWAFLQRICEDPEFEHEDIGAYLSATGIVPYKDCINVTYDTFGGLYEIPNYCIHFPSKYDLPEFHKEKQYFAGEDHTGGVFCLSGIRVDTFFKNQSCIQVFNNAKGGEYDEEKNGEKINRTGQCRRYDNGNARRMRQHIRWQYCRNNRGSGW